MIELLTVIAIFAIVGAIIIPNLGSSQASQLTASANQIVDTIAMAREVALSKNQPVEVWLLRAHGDDFITAVQVRLVDASGATSGWGGLLHLATGIGIDTGSTLSTIVNAENTKQWDSSGAPKLGSLGTEYDCWYVRFQPDGTPTLSQDAQQYLTMHKITDGNGHSTLPPNYAVVSISAVTGKASLYRP